MSYKGNNIGISKVEGILKQKTNLKDWKYRDFLPGPEPFVTKDIDDEHKNLQDKKWYERYADSTGLAVERRADDVVRIAKFIASGRGIWWESKMAGLETMQKDLQRDVLDKYKTIQDSAPEDKKSFWQALGGLLADAGKSILTNIGLTASTLAQTAVSGTGTRTTTYAPRAYLQKGTSSGILTKLLAGAGVIDGDYLVGANYVLKGQNIPINGTSIPSDKRFIPAGDATQEQHATALAGMDPVHEKVQYGVNTALKGAGVPKGPSTLITGSGFKFDINQTIQQLFEAKGMNYTASSGPEQPNSPKVPVQSDIRSRDLENIEQGNRFGTVLEVTQSAKSTPGVALTKESEEERYVRDVDRHIAPDFGNYYWDYEEHGGGKVSRSNNSVFLSGSLDDESKATYNSGSTVATVTGNVNYLESEDRTLRGREQSGTTYVIKTGNRKVSPAVGESSIQEIFYHTFLNGHGGEGGVKDTDISTENKAHLEKKLGLTPFCISTITPEHRTYINFPINLESYEDNYTGAWESTQYVGRGENFYGYTGFTRSINFSFKVVALHPRDLLELYRRLNRLAGATAPSYTPDGLFMRGTLSCITIGDLLVEQFGFIPNIKISWQKDYLWVPGVDNKEDENESTGWLHDSIMLPEILDVSVSFTPIERNNVRENYKSFFVFKPKEGVVSIGEVEREPEKKVVREGVVEVGPLEGYIKPELVEENKKAGPDKTEVSYNQIYQDGFGGAGGRGGFDRDVQSDTVDMSIMAEEKNRREREILGLGGNTIDASGNGYYSGGSGKGMR